MVGAKHSGLRFRRHTVTLPDGEVAFFGAPPPSSGFAIGAILSLNHHTPVGDQILNHPIVAEDRHVREPDVPVRGCPIKLSAALTSQEFLRDRAATVRRMQAAGGVVEVKFPLVGRVWMTTTQELASRVLKDGKLFTVRKDDGDVAGMRWWMPRILRVLTSTMASADDKDHARLRGIVDEAFRRRAVLEMEPRIRAIADELAAAMFAQGSPADLVTRYAQTAALAGDLRVARPAARRPTKVHRLGRSRDGESAARSASCAHSRRFRRSSATWNSNWIASARSAAKA